MSGYKVHNGYRYNVMVISYITSFTNSKVCIWSSEGSYVLYLARDYACLTANYGIIVTSKLN